MNQYQIFDEQSVIQFVKQNTNLFVQSDHLSAVEFGDGNLNLVFRVNNELGKSVIVKQALPYARCVGESWPLTLDRARIEAEVLAIHGQYCPELTVKILHQDNLLAATIMEDLSHMAILRGEHNQGKQFPLLGEHVGEYIARTTFFTSDFYLSGQEKKALVAQFINPELCQITEDLILTDPYTNHERNNYPPALADRVYQLSQDKALRLAVAKLKTSFLSSPQALLHGDVHAGSIFVDRQQTKLIDPEFAFVGPIAFDLGSFVGNLLLSSASQHGRIVDGVQRQHMQDYLSHTLARCVHTFAETFSALMANQSKDPILSVSENQQAFLAQVLTETIGFAGTEMIRRTVGLAHVSDIDGIDDEKARLAVQNKVIDIGQALVLNQTKIAEAQDVIAVINQELTAQG